MTLYIIRLSRDFDSYSQVMALVSLHLSDSSQTQLNLTSYSEMSKEVSGGEYVCVFVGRDGNQLCALFLFACVYVHVYASIETCSQLYVYNDVYEHIDRCILSFFSISHQLVFICLFFSLDNSFTIFYCRIMKR